MTAPTSLLDTDTVVALLRDRPATVRERFRREVANGALIAVSTITIFELWYGVARSGRPRDNEERLRLFLAGNIHLLPFAADDTAVAGRIRAALAVSGRPIGPYDLLIAAQALHRSVPVVTANVGEFSRIDGLRWEDWTIPS